MTLGFVVVGFGALPLHLLHREGDRAARRRRSVSMKQSFAILKSNKPLLLLCLSSFLFLTGMLALSTVQLYYLRDVLHALPLYAVLSHHPDRADLRARGRSCRRSCAGSASAPATSAAALVMVAGGLIVFLAPPSRCGSRSPAWCSAMVGLAPRQHARLGARGRHRRVRRVEDRRPRRGHHLRAVLVHPQDRPGRRRRARRLRPGDRRLRRRRRDAVGRGRVGHPRRAPGCCPPWPPLLAVLIMFFYPLTDKRHREIVAEIAATRRRRTSRVVEPGLSTAAFRRRPPRDRPRRAHDRLAVDRQPPTTPTPSPTTTRKSTDP